FNGQTASVSSWSDGQIVTSVPVTSASGPAVVTVNGVPSNNTVAFTVPPPSVGTLSPYGGIVGTSVTIGGSGFQANQRHRTITFNGVAATVTSWSDTQIVASVPTSATTGPVRVTVNSVASSSNPTFTVPNLTITSVTPGFGPVGGNIVVTGSGFGATRGQGYNVNFNGAWSTIVSWSDTSITAVVPPQGSTGPVTVTEFNATSNGVQFTVEGPPTVSGVSPAVAPVGTTVTLTGTGFGPTQSTSSVQFSPGGSGAAIISWSDTQVVATGPPGSITGVVGVWEAGVGGSKGNSHHRNASQESAGRATPSSYNSTRGGGAGVETNRRGWGSTRPPFRETITNTADNNGNVLTTTDELGHTTTY